MRFTQSLVSAILLAAAGVAHAASSWSFDDGNLAVSAKKASEGIKEKYATLANVSCVLMLTAFYHRLNAKSPVSKPVALGGTDTLKVTLTAKENGKAKRPHQAFVVLKEQDSGLEVPFPLTTKENGKAVVQIVRAADCQKCG